MLVCFFYQAKNASAFMTGSHFPGLQCPQPPSNKSSFVTAVNRCRSGIRQTISKRKKKSPNCQEQQTDRLHGSHPLILRIKCFLKLFSVDEIFFSTAGWVWGNVLSNKWQSKQVKYILLVPHGLCEIPKHHHQYKGFINDQRL